jgi:ATP-dependent DNA helicase RecG
MSSIARLSLESPVEAVDRRIASRRMGAKHDGPAAGIVLRELLGIETVGDLLHHYPRRYIDRSRVQPIRSLKVGQVATVIAHVTEVKNLFTKRTRKSMVIIKLFDTTSYATVTFFNQPWTMKTYRPGMEVAVTGTVSLYRGTFQFQNQVVEILRTDERDLVHMGRITPIHRAAEGITPRTIRELVWRAIDRLPHLPDPMPAKLIGAEGLDAFDEAVRAIHFPRDDIQLRRAEERLKFDELFTLELGVAFRKHRLETEQQGVAHRADGPLTEGLLRTLPFTPTGAQERAMRTVDGAMTSPHPMNLLLQGDVGSGKTLVALHAALVAVQSKHQAAVMAPTEVLAGQHDRSIAWLLEGLGAVPYLEIDRALGSHVGGQVSLLDVNEGSEDQGAPDPGAVITYALLSASVTGKDRARILDGIAGGGVDIVVGTHALVQEGVAFHDLSLAVVDEQHRFGLHQRMALKGKGGEADVLIMTATPIPRTLALTYYGDLDVAVLDELPAGRLPISTWAVRDQDRRLAAYELVRQEVSAGRQAFVVCAAIDEGNRTQVKAAEAVAERLATEVFPRLRVDLLHGRMRPKDKERIMDEFRSGQADVLISTTVIEVGVDVPNATVMLVENAERFGLAQLHQLRGRIGRGVQAGTCVLFDESDPTNLEARARIEAMVRTTDGFELADEDLRLRGEGTLFDTKQSGMPDLKLARLAEDAELVARARARAFAIVADDPRLERHPELAGELRIRFADSIDWLFRS